MRRKEIFFIGLVAAIGIGYGAGKLYYGLTDGFSVDNIVSHIPNDKNFQLRPLSDEERETARSALTQKYTYLAKGHQAYVFAGEDGRFVLKFLKFHRNRLKPWVKYYPSIPILNAYVQKRRDFKDHRMMLLLNSWKTAFDELQEENGLIAVQIDPGASGTYPVTEIVDKVGRSHLVDLNHMTFLLQERAVLFCPEIDALMKNGDEESAKRRLDQFLDLTLSEYRRGYAETDVHVLRNTGFLKDRAIHIDAGRFSKDDRYLDPEIQKRELEKKCLEVSDWLKAGYPSLDSYFHRKILDLFNC